MRHGVAVAVPVEVVWVGVGVVLLAISAVAALGVAVWVRPQIPGEGAADAPREPQPTTPPALTPTVTPAPARPAERERHASVPPAEARTLPPLDRMPEPERQPLPPELRSPEEEDLTVFGDDAHDAPTDEALDGMLAVAIPLYADTAAERDEPTAEVDLLLVSASGQTDVGRRREGNEDSYLALEDLSLFAIADGMGGHAGGEVASRMAVDTLEEQFRSGQFDPPEYPDLAPRAGRLAQSIQSANRRVWDRARRNEDLDGMGTTLVAAWFVVEKHRVYVGHVGDSRIYRLRDGQLRQITVDHTLGALGMGGRFAQHLARAVGAEPAVVVDLITCIMAAGDRYLLCSDGLSKMASDTEIQELLEANPDPAAAVAALVGRANSLGGKDNITVIVVNVNAAGSPSAAV